MTPRKSRWARSLILVLTGANLISLAGYFALRWHVNHLGHKPQLAVGSVFPAFLGIDIEGERWSPQKAPCRIIRVTDDDCTYCKQDRNEYQSLVTAGVIASCEVVEIAPRASGIGRTVMNGVTQLKYVNADLGEALFPFVTPQTIIVDENWVVQLTKRGVLDSSSTRRAVAILDKLRGAEVVHAQSL
jgi:hypothetical protein